MNDTEKEILTNVLLALEGSKTTGYVPDSNKPQSASFKNSGVTIGKGLDLGSSGKASLINNLNISQSLKDKLLATVTTIKKNKEGKKVATTSYKYIGKKGTKANEVASDLTITADEEKELNKALVDRYSRDFETDYQLKIGKSPDNLSLNQKIGLASLYFNMPSVLNASGL